MGRIVLGAVAALMLAGCSSAAGSAMGSMTRDLGWDGCPNGPASVWLTGVIVPGDSGAASLKDDQGVVHILVWGTHNSAVVDWGGRYRIGGQWFNADGGRFWACGGATSTSSEDACGRSERVNTGRRSRSRRT